MSDRAGLKRLGSDQALSQHDGCEGLGRFLWPAGQLSAGITKTFRNAAKPGPGELAWKTASVWNDRGDTAFLVDPAGAVVSSKKG